MPENVDLRTRLELLEMENSRLRAENEFLKGHPAILQGLKGERIALRLTKGFATDFASEHDVYLKDGTTLEVKYSKLHNPAGGSTRRWTWSKPLG